jgi:hypothetical protein
MPISESSKKKIYMNSFFVLAKNLVSEEDYLEYINSEIGIITVEGIVTSYLADSIADSGITVESYRNAMKHFRGYILNGEKSGSTVDLPIDSLSIDNDKLSNIIYDIADKWYGHTKESLLNEASRVYGFKKNDTTVMQALENSYQELLSSNQIRLDNEIIKTDSLDRYIKSISILNERTEILISKMRLAVERRFPPPQLTYDRFIAEINDWMSIIKKQLGLARETVEIASGHTKKVRDVIGERIGTARLILDKADEFAVELVNTAGEDNSIVNEVDNLLLEMQSLMDSLKNYE